MEEIQRLLDVSERSLRHPPGSVDDFGNDRKEEGLVWSVEAGRINFMLRVPLFFLLWYGLTAAHSVRA